MVTLIQVKSYLLSRKNMALRRKIAPAVRKNNKRRPWSVAIEIEPGLPVNQSLIFAVIMLKHVSMLATMRVQMSLARASKQPAAQQAKTIFGSARPLFARFLEIPPGRPTFAQRPNPPGSRPVRPYGQSGPVHMYERLEVILSLNIVFSN